MPEADREHDSDTPLLAQLVKAVNWVHHNMQLEVTNSGFGPFNISQGILLCNVKLGINRPADIARSMGLSRQAVSAILKDLELQGVTEMRPDPAHKRAKIVCISTGDGERGPQAVTRRAVSTVDERLVKRIGARRFRNLKTALDADWGPIGD